MNRRRQHQSTGAVSQGPSITATPSAQVLGAQIRLTCPRCGLTIAARSQWIAAQHCPRCVARAHKLVALLTASESAPPSVVAPIADEPAY
jgi:hypothetical protein